MDDLAQPAALELSVIVPARNEAENLSACLASLVAQSEAGFALGQQWELIVVDDNSTDLTREIASAVEGVTLLQAPELTSASAFTGKNAACWAGAQAARGALLLFTDADTIHEPGDLSRARHELEKYKVAMLSYSPRQIVSGLAQHALMPLVFAELAKTYPPAQVNNPSSPVAAANGQFVLVDAQSYFDAGGHRAVGSEVLEDVALARNLKRGTRTLRLRYAPDALSARMYRTTSALVEGWTKNLALLFPSPLLMAALAIMQFVLLLVLPLIAIVYPFLVTWQRAALWVVWARGLIFFFNRVRRSNFSWLSCMAAILGLPFFAALLVRSWLQVRLRRQVEWKGRRYRTGAR